MTLVDRINSALRRVPVGPLYVVGFVPAAAYFWLALENRLGADPVKVLEHEYGLIALQLLHRGAGGDAAARAHARSACCASGAASG